MNVTPLADRNDETPGTGCPDAELLASYLDGVATPEERAQIDAHVATCEDCYFVIAETVHEQGERPVIPSPIEPPVPVPAPRPWQTRLTWSGAGLAAAAALVLLFRIVTLPGNRPGTESQIASGSPSPAPVGSQPSPLVGSPQPVVLMAALNLLDASTGEFRPLQPRLEGGFQYRPLKPVTRSAAGPDEAPLNVREAALAVESAATSPGAGTAGQRARAAMYLMTGKPNNAVAILEPLASDTRDAGLLTDLTAAYLSRGGPGDDARGRATAERAVQADPKRPEAWFNLALAAEALDTPARATDAWKKFLELDSTSGWAEEARRHLDRLNRRARR
jgi:putative zinc finger protein